MRKFILARASSSSAHSRSAVAGWRASESIPDGAFTKTSRISEKSFEEIRYGKKYSQTESGHHYIKEKVADLTLVEKAVIDVINELRKKDQMALPVETIAGFIVTTYQGHVVDKEKKANAEAAAKIIKAEKN